MDDLDGLRDIALIQSALRGDFEFIAHYGEEHPGAWAGAWFENEPDVRIVAAFTGDAAQHDAALRPGLQHPGRLVVQSRQHSLSALRRIREEINRTLHASNSKEWGRWRNGIRYSSPSSAVSRPRSCASASSRAPHG